MTKKSPPGRPPLPPGEARSVAVLIKMRPAERDEIRRRAEKAGLSVGEYMRRRGLGQRTR